MSTPILLKAESRARSGTGHINQLRREGCVPAVLYGEGHEPKNLKINTKTFRDLLNHSASENILVNVEIEGKEQMALIQDVQHDPLSGTILHADLLAVSDKRTIKARVPLVLEGEPKGVKIGGLLEHLIHSLQVVCLPKDLPTVLVQNVSELGVGESLTIGSMTFPEGVRPVLNPQVLIAVVAESRVTRSAEAVTKPTKKK